MERFVNLHSHTAGSHLDAIIRVPDLFRRVFELGQRAISVTDHGNMSSIWAAYEEYKKYKADGKTIKLIPGNEIYFCEDLSDPKAKRRHLVLLASNEIGYKNLLRVTAAGFRNSVAVMGREFPRVDKEILLKFNEGLFATSACGGSLIAAALLGGDKSKALEAAMIFKSIYGDRFFIELQPHDLTRGNFNQVQLNNSLKEVAEELKIEMVATCDSHYLTAAHEKYHDMVLAISSKKSLDDPDRHRYATIEPCIVCLGEGVFPQGSDTTCHACMGTKIGRIKPCTEFYLKSEQQIADFFTKHYGPRFASTLIDNCSKIADSCECPDYMEPTKYRLPTFPWKDECDSSEFIYWKEPRKNLSKIPDDAAYLRFKVWKKFSQYSKDMTAEDKKKYWDRVLLELDTLESRNFSSYMLIVSDYVNWARTNGILVGNGRGSVGGSFIAFLLGIHRADPIKYGLLFERFHNKEKASMPDIDLDFAPSGREMVVEYCRKKYGSDKVAYISNILRLTPKLIIKDVARSLCIGGDKSTAFHLANEVTADIPDIVQDEKGKVIKVDTMEKAIKFSRKLQSFVHEYPEILDYANNLIGLPRGFATHAAGIIIADIPLDEYVPLRRDKDGIISIQYDKDTCEKNLLVKMDFLGLETLDIISETRSLAKLIGIQTPALEDIADDDSLTYKLIQSGNVAGVFQLSGAALVPLCKSLKPATIEDIAHINALGRPSVPDEEKANFIMRRFGKSPIKYLHPILEPILKKTYGVSVYEEDLLRLANHVAGWDLAEADGLRKLTKAKEKGAALAIKLEEKFITDAQKHSHLKLEEAKNIWEKIIVPWAGYGFNLSHAILYSMLSYQTAYYKAHYTGPFFCAMLNSETRGNAGDKRDKVDILKKDAKRFKIEIVVCDINISKQYYTLKDKRTIVTGLGAIKGIGDKALNAIIESQPYSSFVDFLHKTPSSQVNKSIIIALAKAGAFDSFGISRKFAAEHYADIRKDLLHHIRKLPGNVSDNEAVSSFVYKYDGLKNEEWSLKEKLGYEKEVLGEYISGKAEEIYPNFFKNGIYSQSFTKIPSLPVNTNFALEGIITAVREIVIKKPGKNQGKAMLKATIENMRNETTEVAIWTDVYEKFKRYLNPGVPIRGLFKISEFNGTKNLSIVNMEAVYRETK